VPASQEVASQSPVKKDHIKSRHIQNFARSACVFIASGLV
jgi:hypothetical protein